MVRFQLKDNPSTKPNYTPVECFFNRAISFKPNDAKVYQLYGYYLKKRGKLDMAVTQYEKAVTIKPVNGETHYALGNLYFDLKKYEPALEQAKLAQSRGHKKTSLARKLKSVGAWPSN